jgi:hypothetical protein
VTMLNPEATFVLGNIKLKLATAIANMASPSLASEVNAAGSLDVSLFVVGDFEPTFEPNVGNAPPRLATKLQLPTEGLVQLQPITVEYVYGPQALDTADVNKAKAFLLRGVLFYAVERRGLDAETVAYAATQRARTWYFRAGLQNQTTSGDGEFRQFVIRQQLFPLVEPVSATIAA